MSDVHSSAEDLAAYFRGLLPAERAQAVEAHCAGCEACADKLVGEARLEVALYDVFDQIRAEQAIAPDAVRVRRTRRQARPAVLAGAFFAFAAAAAAFLVTRSAPVSMAKDPGVDPSSAAVPSDTLSDAIESSPPMRTAVATATTMFILSAPLPGCTACAGGSSR